MCSFGNRGFGKLRSSIDGFVAPATPSSTLLFLVVYIIKLINLAPKYPLTLVNQSTIIIIIELDQTRRGRDGGHLNESYCHSITRGRPWLRSTMVAHGETEDP